MLGRGLGLGSDALVFSSSNCKLQVVHLRLKLGNGSSGSSSIGGGGGGGGGGGSIGGGGIYCATVPLLALREGGEGAGGGGEERCRVAERQDAGAGLREAAGQQGVGCEGGVRGGGEMHPVSTSLEC